MARIDLVGIHDAEVALDFLLHHMRGDTRMRMMAEHPTIYSKLFPSVSTDRITEKVREAIERTREAVSNA